MIFRLTWYRYREFLNRKWFIAKMENNKRVKKLVIGTFPNTMTGNNHTDPKHKSREITIWKWR